MTKEQTNSWEEKRETIEKAWTMFLSTCDIPHFEAACALKLAEENYTNGRISQEKEKWLQIIETKREECKKYPLKSMNGSITDKTANDMVDVALLDIINLIQKQ